RSVAQALRTVHGAGHAGRAEDALPAHPAVEQQPLDRALHRRHGSLEALIADPLEERMQPGQDALKATIKGVETASMPYRPQAYAVHQTPAGSVDAALSDGASGSIPLDFTNRSRYSSV